MIPLIYNFSHPSPFVAFLLMHYLLQ